MSESKSSPITTRVIAGVITAAVIGAASFVPGVFRWLSDMVMLAWSHLNDTSSLPNWGLYLLFGMGFPSVIAVINRLKKEKGPTISQYTEDQFFGVTWRWHYSFGNRPSDIWAFCPLCETVLVYGYEYQDRGDQVTVLTCETCNRHLVHNHGDKDYLVAKVHRQIDRKIRTGEWQSVIKSNPEHGAQPLIRKH